MSTHQASAADQAGVSIPLGEDYPDIRESVRRICQDFPGKYWRDLEAQEAYPSGFVQAMTDAGYLAALIPEEYGGAGLPLRAASIILEEIHAEGCSAAAAHAQMYIMGTLLRHGSPEQKRRYLPKIASGELRLQAFGVTEPTTGSDTTRLKTRAMRDGDHYVINGRKWWISGAGDPRCKIFIVMGKTDPDAPRHSQQSMILVPADTPGLNILRPLPVFGYDDAPHGHCEIVFDNVRVPASNMLLGEGRGFEIAQGRLGPGRIHHCMRAIGTAERALELMCKRLDSRVAFGRKISEQGVWRERIAEARIRIDSARLLVLKAAYMMDTVGNKVAKTEIAMIKVLAPIVAQQVIDWAIQAHGAGGVSDDFPLAQLWAHNRTLRLADGPDEVHRNAIAKLELAKYVNLPGESIELPITRS